MYLSTTYKYMDIILYIYLCIYVSTYLWRIRIWTLCVSNRFLVSNDKLFILLCFRADSNFQQCCGLAPTAWCSCGFEPRAPPVYHECRTKPRRYKQRRRPRQIRFHFAARFETLPSLVEEAALLLEKRLGTLKWTRKKGCPFGGKKCLEQVSSGEEKKRRTNPQLKASLDVVVVVVVVVLLLFCFRVTGLIFDVPRFNELRQSCVDKTRWAIYVCSCFWFFPVLIAVRNEWGKLGRKEPSHGQSVQEHTSITMLLSACLSVCLPVCLSVCLSLLFFPPPSFSLRHHHHHPFSSLFPPNHFIF